MDSFGIAVAPQVMHRNEEVPFMHAQSMAGKHMNKGARRRFRLLMAFLLCVFVWFCVIVVGQSGKLRERAQVLASVEVQQQTHRQTNEDLKKEAERLNDFDYRMELARKQLNMIRPGETGFDIPKKR
jgi:cell division protein FtsB